MPFAQLRHWHGGVWGDGRSGRGNDRHSNTFDAFAQCPRPARGRRLGTHTPRRSPRRCTTCGMGPAKRCIAPGRTPPHVSSRTFSGAGRPQPTSPSPIWAAPQRSGPAAWAPISEGPGDTNLRPMRRIRHPCLSISHKAWTGGGGGGCKPFLRSTGLGLRIHRCMSPCVRDP